ncbi:MAG: tetratricopeptide repeat protein [Deltaproteobacteria bacterium]|nr:tetratricopeptide repeat protein [Deltaproteobacteria bacterium]
MRAKAVAVVVVATLGLGLACQTAPETKPDPPADAPPLTEPEATPSSAPKNTEPVPPTSTPPTPVPPPPAAPPPGPKAGDRTGDGIDDENWLPRKDTPAYSSFLAAVEVARKDPGAAVPRFVDAASKSTGFYAAWFNAGAAAEAAGDNGSAERHYRQALVVRPDYGLALTNLSSLLTRTGRDGDAQKLVDDAVRKFPEKAGPHLAAATRAFAMRELPKAEEEARAAMRYDERNVPAMLLMARVFRAQGRYETARFAVDNALALEPGNALLHLERANVLHLQGESKDAVVAYERASRLRPNLAEAQEGYGLLLLELGFAAEARAAFESLVRLEPKSAPAQLHLGNAYRATKMYPQAEQAYKKALELDKTLDEARFNLGVLYVDDALPGMEEVARWQLAVRELKQYKEQAHPDVATTKRLDDYIESTEKRIVKEVKRKEREEKRKAEDAKKPPEPPPPPPAAAKTPDPKDPTAKADPKAAAPVAGNPEAAKGVDDK